MAPPQMKSAFDTGPRALRPPPDVLSRRTSARESRTPALRSPPARAPISAWSELRTPDLSTRPSDARTLCVLASQLAVFGLPPLGMVTQGHLAFFA